MIIRVQSPDREVNNNIISYFRKFKFQNYYTAINKIEDDIKWRKQKIDAEELLSKYFTNEEAITPAEKQRFVKYVKDSVVEYLVDNTSLSRDYILNNTEVSVSKILKYTGLDNGEVVYYFFPDGVTIVL